MYVYVCVCVCVCVCVGVLCISNYVATGDKYICMHPLVSVIVNRTQL